jgi:hypothetical protein
MARKPTGGEGNREADRRYREHVEKSVRKTPEADRAERARDMDEEEVDSARSAEEKGRSRARH